MDEGSNALLLAGLIAAALIAAIGFVLRKGANRRTIPALVAGATIGLLVVAAWWLTGVVGADEFEPTQLGSLSFVAPTGESLQYLMLFTGDTIRWTIALPGGVLVGAFASAAVNGRLHFQGFVSEGAVLRYIAGGALMGFGGVTALGCSVGQGLSGVSTASPASLLALVAIVVGAFATQRYLGRDTSAIHVTEVALAKAR